MASDANYNSWTRTALIQRVWTLEAELGARPESPAQQQAQGDARDASPLGAAKGKRKMDPSRYSMRFIALKLAYLGKDYGGFEFQAMANQPSIEEELWKALTKSCLIFPGDERTVQFDCCEYSKCGRTDRGVSAFGQVIGLSVRSNRPLPQKKRAKRDNDNAAPRSGETDRTGEGADETVRPFDDVRDEMCYPRILNRILPPDIRILAWCPSPPPGFSARFSCRERQYRYFFTQPAFAPEPSFLSKGGAARAKTGWLDVAAMRDAAKRFEGEHDFRNFCKIDPAKQITDFRRRIFEADIVEAPDVQSALPYLCDASFAAADAGSGPHPKVYYFHVRGSAFLWHQIRHMVAIVFLVGQGLESPSLVSELLDVSKNPRRPGYVMADEVPLVLWDCVFPRDEVDEGLDRPAPEAAERWDALEWIYVGDEHAANRYGQFGLIDAMWEIWRQRKMDELLANQLLQHISQQGAGPPGEGPPGPGPPGPRRSSGVKGGASVRVFEGGNNGRLGGRYVGVMNKELMQPPEEQNDRYAERKGYADAEDMRAQKAQKGMGRGRDE